MFFLPECSILEIGYPLALRIVTGPALSVFDSPFGFYFGDAPFSSTSAEGWWAEPFCP